MHEATIGNSTKFTFGIVISLVGAIGSAAVSYAVTTATLQSEAAVTKSRLDYSRDQRDQMQRDIVEIKVNIGEIKGILSSLKDQHRR